MNKVLRKLICAVATMWLFGIPVLDANAAFDHSHAAWNDLLKRHVVPISEGNASQVNYAGLAADRAQLQVYLASVAGVSRPEYEGFTSPQKLAFLINAYNAYTVEFILTRYPDLKSIKDLGSLLTSPWKKKFPRLFGEEKTLDEIEHGLIRAPGTFDEPRIHMAVVCASVGCPALRNEAFVAEKIDAQLDDGVKRMVTGGSVAVVVVVGFHGHAPLQVGGHLLDDDHGPVVEPIMRQQP